MLDDEVFAETYERGLHLVHAVIWLFQGTLDAGLAILEAVRPYREALWPKW